MTPQQWMDKVGKTATDLSREWGLQVTSILRPISGERRPSYQIILLFYFASGKKVQIRDWLKVLPVNRAELLAPTEKRGKWKNG